MKRFIGFMFIIVSIFPLHGQAIFADDRIHIAQACHPSYEGECVPIASDADCASGSGNGPAYVYGRVRVVGPDEYGLDSDGDGIGCDNQ